MKRKIILTAFAATSLIFSSTQAFALINFSAGIPFSHTVTGKYSDGTEVKTDGVSGMFIQVGVPIFPGVGMDSYKTKLKDSTAELATTIYNLYYLLPIPGINLTLGVGAGSTELQCAACSSAFESYRSVSSKMKLKAIYGGTESDFGGNVMGLGIGFNF